MIQSRSVAVWMHGKIKVGLKCDDNSLDCFYAYENEFCLLTSSTFDFGIAHFWLGRK